MHAHTGGGGGLLYAGVFENVTPVQSSCDLWLFRLKNQTHVDLYYSEAKEIGYDIFLKKNNMTRSRSNILPLLCGTDEKLKQTGSVVVLDVLLLTFSVQMSAAYTSLMK